MKNKLNIGKVVEPNPRRLRDARLARGLAITELSEMVGVSRQAISQFELGSSTPSGSVLSKIYEVLDFPIAYFSKPINSEKSSSSTTFFRSLKSSSKKYREMTLIRGKWLEEICDYLDGFINFPKVNLPNLEENEDIIDDDTIEDIALNLRKYWGLGVGPISNVILLNEKNGIIVSKILFNDVKTDACSFWRKKRPYIFLGSDKDSAVRSRFDAAHELAHLLLHTWVDNEQIRDKTILDRLEKEANRFAAAFLLPEESFTKEIMSTSLDHFITLKKRWKVSLSSMIYRCETLGILSERQVLYLRKQLSKFGYRKREPLDDELLPEEPTVLTEAINLLIDKGVLFKNDLLDNIKLPQDELEQLCNLPKGYFSRESTILDLNLKNNY